MRRCRRRQQSTAFQGSLSLGQFVKQVSQRCGHGTAANDGCRDPAVVVMGPQDANRIAESCDACRTLRVVADGEGGRIDSFSAHFYACYLIPTVAQGTGRWLCKDYRLSVGRRVLWRGRATLEQSAPHDWMTQQPRRRLFDQTHMDPGAEVSFPSGQPLMPSLYPASPHRSLLASSPRSVVSLPHNRPSHGCTRELRCRGRQSRLREEREQESRGT